MKVLKVEKIVKDYGSLRAVNEVSFDIEEGEIFGLLGPNGAGKTTLISTIMTLEEVNSGKIQICGHDLNTDPFVCKSLTGFMPQELISNGYFNVYEVVGFYSGFNGVWPDKKRIEYLLKRLSLWDKRNKKVRTLSGGMKRRVLLAKALVHFPKLLILDEPTAGVDIGLRNQIWEFIEELKNEKVSILFTTHYLEEAEKLCDRVAIIHHGKIRQIGFTKDLISQFTTRVVHLKLSHPIKINSPYYKGEKEGYLVFMVPHSVTIGDLIREMSININDILDIKVREGSLEDAFTTILKD